MSYADRKNQLPTRKLTHKSLGKIMMTMLRYAAPILVQGQQRGARKNKGGREAGEVNR